MYCSNCGNELKPDLRYCNSCGYKLPEENINSGEGARIARTLTTAAGFVGVVGLIGALILVNVLMDSPIMSGPAVVILIAYLATVFGICAFALKQARHFLVSDSGEKRAQPQKEPPLAMPQRDTNQLGPAQTPPASVTENTTRTLDKVPIERES